MKPNETHLWTIYTIYVKKSEAGFVVERNGFDRNGGCSAATIWASLMNNDV